MSHKIYKANDLARLPFMPILLNFIFLKYLCYYYNL